MSVPVCAATVAYKDPKELAVCSRHSRIKGRLYVDSSSSISDDGYRAENRKVFQAHHLPTITKPNAMWALPATFTRE